MTFLLAFFFIQILRYKTLSDLGEYWTTRIIVLENAPLTNNGIYEYLKHPNYIIVFIEVFLICLIFHDYLDRRSSKTELLTIPRVHTA